MQYNFPFLLTLASSFYSLNGPLTSHLITNVDLLLVSIWISCYSLQQRQSDFLSCDLCRSGSHTFWLIPHACLLLKEFKEEVETNLRQRFELLNIIQRFQVWNCNGKIMYISKGVWALLLDNTASCTSDLNFSRTDTKLT